MKQNKYIIIDELFPILFTECQTHKDLAHGMRVTSAGFFCTSIEKDKIKVHCYGESISLNIKNQPDDARLIEKFLSSDWN